MPALHADELVRVLVDAFTECGATAVQVPATRKQPKRFFVQTGQVSLDLWIYAWTLTHGGGAARPKDEYRVQLTGVTAPLGMNPRGPTILIGYEPGLQCFAGFDLRKHQRFSLRSPSIQININALHDALRDGFSFVIKGNDEIAIGFRPDQILAYALNAELLHSQGADAKVAALLAKATSLAPIVDRELLAVSKERQKLVATVSRLSRESDFRRKVVVAYDRKCAVTGIQLRLVDAAHILPVGATGSNDEVSNGLCLSPTYHRAYDRGLVYLDSSLVMRVNAKQERELVDMRLDGGLTEFRSYLDRPIRLPADRRQWPDLRMIQKANMFRSISA
jgi:putative restriction endonuclease